MPPDPPRLVASLRSALAALAERRRRSRYASESYSQEGEDMILRRIFESRPTGFYVDVGAHHPYRFSNTYYFYRRGWRGINIEARPGSMDLFRRLRPRDINLEIPVSDARRSLTYHVFGDPALNTLSEEMAARRIRSGASRLLARRTMEARTLADLLDEHLPAGQTIDFLTVDVEGLDREVLISNDWSRYRPDVVLVEELSLSTLEQAGDAGVTGFLENHGYRMFCKTFNTLFFRPEGA